MIDLPYDSNPVVGPVLRWSDQEVECFEVLLARARGSAGAELECEPGFEKHRLLSYATERAELLAHGSSKGGLAALEPGDQGDLEGRPVNAVFASSDGLWAMFFAILDWTRVTGTFNGTRQLASAEGSRKGYVFTVFTNAQAGSPFHAGWVYLVDKGGFSVSLNAEGSVSDEWLSLAAVRPLARVRVQPDDFPFLGGWCDSGGLEM